MSNKIFLITTPKLQATNDCAIKLEFRQINTGCQRAVDYMI